MGSLCDFNRHLEIDLLRSGVKQGTRDAIDCDTDATGKRL
jgi:hypothetical protein